MATAAAAARAARSREEAQARLAAKRSSTTVRRAVTSDSIPAAAAAATAAAAVDGSAAVTPAVAALHNTRPEAVNVPKRARRGGFFRDTQAGFMVEEEPVQPLEEAAPSAEELRQYYEPAPPETANYPHGPTCKDCEQEFSTSFLLTRFGLAVCNNCRNIHRSGRYGLVTKTTAKNEFLLRDSELSPEHGGLRFVERENPNGELYSKMKLYLRCQVEEKCYARYGDAAGLDQEHERRDRAQEEHKLKRRQKQMAKLRKQTQTSTWLGNRNAAHEHTYPPGDGEYNEEEDEYTKTCTGCGFKYTYEKM